MRRFIFSLIIFIITFLILLGTFLYFSAKNKKEEATNDQPSIEEPILEPTRASSQDKTTTTPVIQETQPGQTTQPIQNEQNQEQTVIVPEPTPQPTPEPGLVEGLLDRIL